MSFSPPDKKLLKLTAPQHPPISEDVHGIYIIPFFQSSVKTIGGFFMQRATLETLENISSKIDTIIGTMSLLSNGIGDKTASRQEISGCSILVLRAISECKEELDNTIDDITDTEVLE